MCLCPPPWLSSLAVCDIRSHILRGQRRRRGAAIDLVLDRPSLSRSQFVFTEARGRPAIWWQTQKTAQAANPGARIPRGRSAWSLTIAVDTREKYGWKFADRALVIERRTLPAGDY